MHTPHLGEEVVCRAVEPPHIDPSGEARGQLVDVHMGALGAGDIPAAS